jgi:hypothetical protein
MKTGLLKNLSRFSRQSMAVMLESQRLTDNRKTYPMNTSWESSSQSRPGVVSSEVSRIGSEIMVSVCEEVSLAPPSTETATPSPSGIMDMSWRWIRGDFLRASQGMSPLGPVPLQEVVRPQARPRRPDRGHSRRQAQRVVHRRPAGRDRRCLHLRSRTNRRASCFPGRSWPEKVSRTPIALR